MPRRRDPEPFDLQPGRTVGGRYTVERQLGRGTEGEVYAVVERLTGIHRAAKLYYPDADPKGRRAIQYARKLDALRHCPILLQYHHQQIVTVKRQPVLCVISELVQGRMLSEFLADEGGALPPFEALHLLHTLAAGIAPIHALGEYHGDLHDENIMVRRRGIGFDVRLLDFHDLGRPSRKKIWKDVLNLIEVFHTITGGRENYRSQPKQVKYFIRGLKDSLILDRFGSAGDIQRAVEGLSWD